MVWSWRWRRRSGWLPSRPAVAEELSEELFERGRAIEAIALTLEAGDHERATHMIMGLSESITDTVEPQILLSLLARLGPATERQPLLLLRRATATRAIGRIDAATRDIDRAVELADAGDPVVRRRVQLEAARARLAEGRREEAVRVVEHALVDLSEGEGQTYARAYELLAECATTSDARARTCSGLPSATAWRPRPGRVAASTPERGPAGATSPSVRSSRSAGTTKRWPSSVSSLPRPTSPTPSGR